MTPPEPLASRWQRARDWMDQQRLDVLLLPGQGPGRSASVDWLAGPVSTPCMLVFPRHADPVLLVQPKALVPFIARLAPCEVRNGGIDFVEPLTALLAGLGLHRGQAGIVEIDSLRTRGIPHLLYLALAARFPGLGFPTVTEEFELLRWPMTPEELAAFAQAAHELDRVMDVWVDACRPGVSAAQAAAEARDFAQREGIPLTALSAESAAMDGSTSMMDPDARTRPIRRGDFVFFESNVAMGPYRAYRGYPICLGEPTGETRRLFDTAQEIARTAASLLRPGGRTGDVLALGQEIARRGFGLHGPIVMGNGTGGWMLICDETMADAYRPPRELAFQPGMTFSCAPHLRLPDWSLVTIVGSSVAVTADGPQVLGSHGIRYVVKD